MPRDILCDIISFNKTERGYILLDDKIHSRPFIGGVVIGSKKAELIYSERNDKKVVFPKMSFGLFEKVPIIRGLIRTSEYLHLKARAMVMMIKTMAEEMPKGKIDKNRELVSALYIIGVFIALIVSFALFVCGPALLTYFASLIISNSMVLSLIEGVLRLVVFFIYLKLTHYIPEFKRLYMYHGAQHKIKSCVFEKEELNYENVLGKSIYNKNCMQYSLFKLAIIVIIYFSLFTFSEIFLYDFLIRVALLPLLVGISYELKNVFYKENNDVSFFGKFIQRFYLEEPSEDILKVNIELLKTIQKGDF